MSCKLKEGRCRGFELGCVHCNEDCEHYEIPKAITTNIYSEWVMVIDDFEDGKGNREYPHCSNCKRGVYRHDAGSYCPFCGKPMKNPMR